MLSARGTRLTRMLANRWGMLGMGAGSAADSRCTPLHAPLYLTMAELRRFECPLGACKCAHFGRGALGAVSTRPGDPDVA